MEDSEFEDFCCYHEELIQHHYIYAMPDLDGCWC
jgi:hypothetical protein